MDEATLRSRLGRLNQLLDIDLEWRLNRVSEGQRRRCQLLLKLLRPSDLLLMDEVTTDLDLIARQALLTRTLTRALTLTLTRALTRALARTLGSPWLRR